MWGTCKTQIVTISESSEFRNLQMVTDGFLAYEGESASSDLAHLVQELFIMIKKKKSHLKQ